MRCCLVRKGQWAKMENLSCTGLARCHRDVQHRPDTVSVHRVAGVLVQVVVRLPWLTRVQLFLELVYGVIVWVCGVCTCSVVARGPIDWRQR